MDVSCYNIYFLEAGDVCPQLRFFQLSRNGLYGERIWRTARDYGDYVSQARLCSFLVSTGFLRAFIIRYERKSMLYRYSSLEVSKMCQLAERKRGSKLRTLLLDVRSHFGSSLWLKTHQRVLSCGLGAVAFIH